MNVFVQRMAKRFGDLDAADAVAFAEQIMESWQRVSPQGGAQSVTAQRELNLALVFLNMKFPFQCCAGWRKEEADVRCPDCPMPSYDVEKQAA